MAFGRHTTPGKRSAKSCLSYGVLAAHAGSHLPFVHLLPFASIYTEKNFLGVLSMLAHHGFPY